jgi:transcriptional regulator with XRE-family HTH domain
MNERIKILRQVLEINQNDLGLKIGVARSHISSIENGARVLTDRTIKDICREFNVNEDWLRYGTGEMFIETDTVSLDEYVQMKNADPLEIEIFKTYLDLPVDVRTAITEHFKKKVFSKGVSDLSEISASKEALHVAESTSEYVTSELSESQKQSINSELELYRLALEAQAKAQKSEVSQSINSRNMA